MELIVKKFEKALELSVNGKSELLTENDRFKIIGKLVCDEIIDDMPNDDELVLMLSKCVNLFDVKPVEKIVVKEVGDETYNANVRLINRLQQQLQEMSFKVIDELVIKQKDMKIQYLEEKVKKMKKVIAKITDSNDSDDSDDDTFENFLEVKQLKKQLNQAKAELSRANEKLNSLGI